MGGSDLADFAAIEFGCFGCVIFLAGAGTVAVAVSVFLMFARV